MNKIKTKILYAVIAFIVGSGTLSAQVDVNKMAQSGMKFLSVSVGARGVAMGDAFVAIADNAEAMFWNPAGMTRTNKQIDVAIGYNKWIADISHQYIGAVYNAGNIGSFGVQMIYVDYGDLDGTRRSDSDPNGYIETGTFSPSAYVIGLSYAKAISDKFSFGANLKYVRQDLGAGYVSTGTTTEENKLVDNKLGEFALDFGTLYYTGYKDLRLAMSITNMSLEKGFIKESFPLPIALKFGVAMDILKAFDINPIHRFTVAIDGIHQRDYTERIHIGAEYMFDNMVAFRIGYKTNYDEDHFATGLGLRVMDALRVDYAYSPFSRLEAVHRISLGYEL
jgi:hypothetical protein